MPVTLLRNSSVVVSGTTSGGSFQTNPCWAQAPKLEDVTPDAIMVAESCLFKDLWQDARALEVVKYLKGGVGLQLPPEWRKQF